MTTPTPTAKSNTAQTQAVAAKPRTPHWFDRKAVEALAADLKMDMPTLCPDGDSVLSLVLHVGAVFRESLRKLGKTPTISLLEANVTYLSRSHKLCVEIQADDDVFFIVFPQIVQEPDPREIIEKALQGHLRSLRPLIDPSVGETFIICFIRQKSELATFKDAARVYGAALIELGEYRLFEEGEVDIVKRRAWLVAVRVAGNEVALLEGL